MTARSLKWGRRAGPCRGIWAQKGPSSPPGAKRTGAEVAQGQVWTRPGRQKESCLVEMIIYGRKSLSRLHPWAGCTLSWRACLLKPSGRVWRGRRV